MTQHGSSTFVLQANESYGVNEEQGSPLETGGDLMSTSVSDQTVDTNDPTTYHMAVSLKIFVLQINELVQGTPSPPNIVHSPTSTHDVRIATTSNYDSTTMAGICD